MLSVSSVKNDIEYIKTVLGTSDCIVPSLWHTFKPALALMIINVSLQMLLTIEEIIFDGLSLLLIFPTIFTLFFSFIVSIGICELRAKYLSLPMEIRQGSVLVKLLKQKVKVYVTVFSVAVVTSWLVIFTFDFPPISYYLFQFVLFFIFSFVYSADMSRYQLTALRGIIGAWREGTRAFK